MAKIPKSLTAGLYVHIPYCTQRCVYCDFYFVTSSRGQDAFINALCTEINRTAFKYAGVCITSIYFGGGTPSRLPISAISRIMREIDVSFDTRMVREVTFEMNPEDVTENFLIDLQVCGITRVSVGIQSFSDEDLAFLNRAHGAGDATRAMDLIQQAKFESWTLDLIFGLPEQDFNQWVANLLYVIDSGVPHLSTYSLTIEPRTPLFNQVKRGLIQAASDEAIATAYQMAMEKLTDAGYTHYEISSFARPGHRAQHNQAYWTHSNYLGLGPSAHSFWWDEQGARRWSNVRNVRKYTENLLSGKAHAGPVEQLTPEQLAAERIMLALRTSDGIPLKILQRDYGVDLVSIQKSELEYLQANGLIMLEPDVIYLTKQGKHLCDSITTRLLPD